MYKKVLTSSTATKTMKKILLVIAFKNFRDEEYFIPKGVFEKDGFQTKTASTKEGTALGLFGGEADVDLVADEIKVKEFDAVVFVGGPGTLEYLDNESFYRIAREAKKESILLGAICIAPVVLANSGVLAEKKATVWTSQMDKKAISILKDGEALYQNEDVVCDGKIITARGPEVAEKFAEEIVQELTKISK